MNPTLKKIMSGKKDYITNKKVDIKLLPPTTRTITYTVLVLGTDGFAAGKNGEIMVSGKDSREWFGRN